MPTLFDIESTLNRHLSDHTEYPVAFDNVPFTPTAGKTYLKASVTDSRPEVIGVGHSGLQRIIGTFEIEIHSPVGTGKADPLAIVNSLHAHFKTASTLTGDNSPAVRIVRFHVKTGYTSNGRYITPVDIVFRTVISA